MKLKSFLINIGIIMIIYLESWKLFEEAVIKPSIITLNSTQPYYKI